MRFFSVLKSKFNSEFLNNTITLIFGTVVAQTIPLLIHPLLRRLYTPEDFGAFAIYFNIISILIILVSLRYEAAIVLPKDDNESINVLGVSVILAFILCSILFVFIFLFKDMICNTLNFPIKYSNYLYLLPFSTLCFSVYQSFNFWLIRKKAFKASSVNKVTRRGFEGVTQIGLGFKQLSFGLFFGDFIGNLANTLSGAIQIIKNDFKIHEISKIQLKNVLNKYAHFPKYNLLPTLLSSVANFLPFFLINKLYSTSDVGYLDLTRLVLSIPLAFISVTISQVLFQQLTSQRNNNQSITTDLKKILFIVMAIVVVEYVVIQLWAPTLFALIFGNNYHISGEYSKILIVSYAINFVVSTFSCIYISFEKLKLYSIWQFAYFIGICSLFIFKNVALQKFLLIFVCIDVLMNIINCFMMLRIVKQYEASLL